MNYYLRMGLTIHFEGRLKSEDDYNQLMVLGEKFAMMNNMEFIFFEESDKVLERVKDEQCWDYHGETKGMRIQPHINSDPLLLEFDTNYYIQEYCKTQFVDTEVHIRIIEFLRLIEPYFEELIVNDEGEYWETNDRNILQNHVDECFKAIDHAQKKNNKLTGPYRIADGRIVDLMNSQE